MKKFIGKTAQSNGHKSESIYNNYVVNSLLIYGQRKFLIVSDRDLLTMVWLILCSQIKEIDVLNVNIPLIDPELFCDVSCLMFDQSDSKSFECVAHIYTVL